MNNLNLLINVAIILIGMFSPAGSMLSIAAGVFIGLSVYNRLR